MPSDVHDPGQLLSVSQVAMELGCSAPTVRRWIAEGHLDARKLHPGRPGMVRIRRSDIDALIGGDDEPKAAA